MSKMKLFYVKGSCSLNPRIIINELGIDVEFIAINPIDKTTEKGEDYIKINPKGSIPALMLESAEVLTEGAIITQYLADTYKNYTLLPELGNFKRYRVLEMNNHIATDLHKSCSPIFNKQIPDQIKNDVLKPILIGRLNNLNTVLENTPYLTGSDFTIADSYLFVVLSWMKHLQVDLSSFVAINEFIAKVNKIPSVIKALEDELK